MKFFIDSYFFSFVIVLILFPIAGKAQDTTHVVVLKNNYVSDFKTFQNALNIKKGKVLKITVKKGLYNISRELLITRTHTYLQFDKGAQIRFTNSNASGFIVPFDYFKIENAIIRGNGISASDFYTGYGILLLGSNYSEVKNNIFDGISGHSIFLYSQKKTGCANNSITGNIIRNSAFKISERGDEAAIMLGYSGADYMHSNNRIERNIIDGKDKLNNGIAFIGHGNGNIINNNKISNIKGYGIVVYESSVSGMSLNNTIISNNEINNIGETGTRKTVKGMGIYLMTANNSTVFGNKVYNTLRNSDQSETLGAGAISVSLSPGTVVEDNLIDGSYMYGIVSDYSFGSKFINNTVQNTRKSGAYFINMNDVVVSGNTFKNIGEVALKGYFENTSLPYIKEQLRKDIYKNINTGNNFKISNNKFFTDKDVLFFISTDEDRSKEYIGNQMNNNVFEDNKIIGNRKNQKELIIFKQKKSGKTSIKNNEIVN